MLLVLVLLFLFFEGVRIDISVAGMYTSRHSQGFWPATPGNVVDELLLCMLKNKKQTCMMSRAKKPVKSHQLVRLGMCAPIGHISIYSK